MNNPSTHSEATSLGRGQQAAMTTPCSLGPEARRDITAAMDATPADVFALYLETKNFHWHPSAPPFRDDYLMLDQQADALYAMTKKQAFRSTNSRTCPDLSSACTPTLAYKP